MTNSIKTVQNPRVILVALQSPERIMSLLSDILNVCSYNTCINDFSKNTDFVIASESFDSECPENAVADTVLFDGKCTVSSERLRDFRTRVTPYENAIDIYGCDPEDVVTYSAENYGADVAVRNLTKENGAASFDIIGNGILSRVNVIDSKYSVEDILICTGVLLAAGLPMASIIGYFDSEEE